mmetsp:Transcript_129254/g.326257  ORF Transcript_129254/g.326257 Transcript_129254/m.326257 type:complete len:335 (+) Transcript_129254:44-1048(+)
MYAMPPCRAATPVQQHRQQQHCELHQPTPSGAFSTPCATTPHSVTPLDLSIAMPRRGQTPRGGSVSSRLRSRPCSERGRALASARMASAAIPWRTVTPGLCGDVGTSRVSTPGLRAETCVVNGQLPSIASEGVQAALGGNSGGDVIEEDPGVGNVTAAAVLRPPATPMSASGLAGPAALEQSRPATPSVQQGYQQQMAIEMPKLANICQASVVSDTAVSEFAQAWEVAEPSSIDGLPPREVREMARDAQKRDKVSLLLGRALVHTRANKTPFNDFRELEDSRLGRSTPTSMSRYLHSKDSVMGGGSRDTRFLRRQDRMTEFVELTKVQTYIFRK